MSICTQSSITSYNMIQNINVVCPSFEHWIQTDKSSISFPYFPFYDPFMKTIVDHGSNAFVFILIIFSASIISSIFPNLSVVLTKLFKRFLQSNFYNYFILFKHLNVLHHSLFFMTRITHHYCKRLC